MFKYRHYQPEIILLCVRWCLRYPLSYRDLEQMMVERGLCVDHTSIVKWVQCYPPMQRKVYEGKALPSMLNPTNSSWRVDETYIKVKGQ